MPQEYIHILTKLNKNNANKFKKQKTELEYCNSCNSDIVQYAQHNCLLCSRQCAEECGHQAAVHAQ